MMIEIPSDVLLALATLEQNGYESWLVGGCVRDYLMGDTPHDWDITTNARPEQVQDAFRRFRVIETGLKHGTVTVLIANNPLEITTFRLETGYSDHRHPDEVRFTNHLSSDLSRRDFTINAMAMSRDGLLRDEFGGQNDLSAGLIRCVGNARSRFQEDGLRILRALRFASVLDFSIERETGLAIHDSKALLHEIASERIQTELTKLLCGAGAGKVLREYSDVLFEIIPELAPMAGFQQHNRHHSKDVWEHTLAVVDNSPATAVSRWAALLHDVGKPSVFSLDQKGEGHFYGHAAVGKKLSDDILQRLRFDRATRVRVAELISHHDTPIPIDAKSVRRYLNRFGAEFCKQLLALMRADNLGQTEEFRSRQQQFDLLEQMFETVQSEDACLSLKRLAINGDDLIRLGYRGKEIGRTLSMLLNAVMDETVENNRDQLLSYLSNGKKVE